MFKKLNLFALLAVFMMIFNACGKYEEGPAFSLATKKARLTAHWKLLEINGQQAPNNVVWIFEKDGSFKMEFNNTPNNNPATWSFEDAKSQVNIYFQQDDVTIKYIIIKLTSNELWLDQIVGSNYVRHKFEREK